MSAQGVGAQLMPASCPPQYLLSPETVEALRKPTFDVWLWEPNEVSEGPPSLACSLIPFRS